MAPYIAPTQSCELRLLGRRGEQAADHELRRALPGAHGLDLAVLAHRLADGGVGDAAVTR